MNLKIIFWNSNGLRNKSDLLRLWLSQNPYSIVCLQEVRKIKIIPKYPFFQSFYFTSNFPPNGGLLIYAHQDITILHEANLSWKSIVDSSQIEWFSVKLPDGTSFRLGNVYRNPHASSSNTKSILHNIKSTKNLGVPILVGGDFNCTRSIKSSLIQWSLDSRLQLLNMSHPNPTFRRSNNFLDIALSNFHAITQFHILTDSILDSDHSPICIVINKQHSIPCERVNNHILEILHTLEYLQQLNYSSQNNRKFTHSICPLIFSPNSESFNDLVELV